MVIEKYFNVNVITCFFSTIELNEYIIVLEKRHDLKGQKEVSGLVAKKSRVIGTPSLPPLNAPRWAVMRGNMLYIYIFYILIIIL